MKAASTALANLINFGNFDDWEVYQFNLVGGGTLLLSTAPFAILGSSWTWPPNGPIVTEDNQQRAHWKVGTDVDSWVVPIAPRLKDAITGTDYPDTIGDQPMLMAMAAGILDGADVTVMRAYFDPLTFQYPGWVGARSPVGFLTIFRGLVADVDLSTEQAIVTLMDFRQLLSTQMPRNVYQPACHHTLYDAGCKLSAAAFAKPGTVTSFESRARFSTNASAPGGSGTYELGRITFLTGRNAGLTRSIQSWDGAALIQVAPPFPFTIAAGDTADLYPGCHKTTAACTAFGNLVNFGDTPFIPPPTTTGASSA